ncbi:MAG: glycosyltransferase family 39 protein [Bacteroidota bacterium]
MNQSKTLPFWLFTLSAISILIVSQLVQDGMFMDGLLYVGVAKNLADGLGNFWEPHYSQTYYTTFREQPPLYFGLLAVFYKFFGTSLYVERLFCFVCLSLTLLFCHKIWKTLFFDRELISKNSWLPILFYISIPICFWAYSNHVEETVMTLFVVMSIYYICKALLFEKRVYLYLILAGICIFLASLTKGIQGLFPVAAVFCYWIVNRKQFSFKKNIIYSSILIGVPLLIYSILIFLNNNIYTVFKLYFENRLGLSFNQADRQTAAYRFEIIVRLFTEMIPVFILMLIIYLFSLKHKTTGSTEKKDFKTIWWLLLIGFSGSIPLMITMEQRGFYLLTSLPFFALGASILMADRMGSLVEKINPNGKWYIHIKRVTIIILLFSITFTLLKVGETKRDKNLLADIYSIGNIVPYGAIIAIPNEMEHDYSTREYLIRYFYISTDNYSTAHSFLMIRKNLPKNLVPANFKLYPLSTKELDLYKRVL